LGYEAASVGPDNRFVIFDYEIEVGRKAGEKIRLAFDVADDFPLNPPGGPHVSPQLFPIHPGQDLPHPNGAVHNSPLGAEWEYWSRPFQGWNEMDKSVRTYMAHIRRLFLTL
jgi:hypothetical protein